MQYLIAFLEGVITFISPCLLPMLPIYIMYLSGNKGDKGNTIKNAIAFVIGFTAVFTILGAFAGTLGVLLRQYQTMLNIITGAIVVIFGLNFLGILNINIFKGASSKNIDMDTMNPLGSLLFGVVFSIGWTPCVGAFLGSALMMASHQGSFAKGVLMLFAYSMGLGIPFILSAILIDRLKDVFDFIKKHYKIITVISGWFLVVIGVLMMTGLFGAWLSLFSGLE